MELNIENIVALVSANCYPERDASSVDPRMLLRDELDYDELDFASLAESFGDNFGKDVYKLPHPEWEGRFGSLRVEDLLGILEGAPTKETNEHPANSSVASAPACIDVLREFCHDVEVAGGVEIDQDGETVPVGAPDWPDLAATYIKACECLKIPVVRHGDIGGEIETAWAEVLESTATSLDEWEEIDGPQTRVGVERWYRHPSGATVWFCDDQGSVVYEVYTSGEDG